MKWIKSFNTILLIQKIKINIKQKYLLVMMLIKNNFNFSQLVSKLNLQVIQKGNTSKYLYEKVIKLQISLKQKLYYIIQNK